jgi:hypothetical protein
MNARMKEEDKIQRDCLLIEKERERERERETQRVKEGLIYLKR